MLFLTNSGSQTGRLRAGSAHFGLGLAICKRLVEMHGGEINARSSGIEGEGTTFSFTLPTMQAASLGGRATVAVWIITIQPEKAEPLKQYLESQGFKVETLLWDKNDQWLVRVTQSPPEAIVLDVHESPERGCKSIRALKAHPSTAIRLYCSMFWTPSKTAVPCWNWITLPSPSASPNWLGPCGGSVGRRMMPPREHHSQQQNHLDCRR